MPAARHTFTRSSAVISAPIGLTMRPANTGMMRLPERDYGVGDPRCRKPGDALARIYAERGDDALAEEVMRRILAPQRKPGAAGEDLEYPLTSALSAVSATLGGWLTAN